MHEGNSEEENPQEKILMKKLNCSKNQARNAMKIARDNMSLAETIIKEFNSEKRTNFVGGNQIVELPKSKYAKEFEELMKHSESSTEKAVAHKKFTIYKNGFLIDEKFFRLSEREIKKRLDKIFKDKELPSDLFNINQNDLIDTEIHDKSEEIYKEEYPGESNTISLSIPTETNSKIELGDNSVVFKLTINGRNSIVKLGGSSNFHPLREYLKRTGITGRLFSEGKEISWDESPENYKRTLLELVQD